MESKVTIDLFRVRDSILIGAVGELIAWKYPTVKVFPSIGLAQRFILAFTEIRLTYLTFSKVILNHLVANKPII